MLNDKWDQALSYASGELKRRVDPFRTVDLGGYLSVAPFVGGALYLSILAIQQVTKFFFVTMNLIYILQTLPEIFSLAYPAGVFVFIAPIIFIVLTT